MTSPNKPTTRLFIGSLPFKYTEGELLALFVPFGRIVAVRIIHNRWGKSRGMGYVEFDKLESAVDAKVKMHNSFLGDRTIIVDYAQPDPFNTPEGQLRHQQALERRPQPHPSISNPKSTAPNFQPWKKFSKPGESIRQTVYDQRFHHAKTGAKFAQKTKAKKSK